MLQLNTRPSSFDIGEPGRGYEFGSSNALASYDLSPAKHKLEIVTPSSCPVTRRFDPITVMYMGRRGQGKTLAMTCMADFQSKRYKANRLPFRVASNYWMEPADIINPKLIDWLNSFHPDARNLYCCIDEVASQMANRRSLSKQNVDFAQQLVQLRKRNNEMAFATQFPQTVDYQILLQIDLFMLVEKFNGGRSLDVYVFDWWGQWTGLNYRKPWPPSRTDFDWQFTIHNVDSMFNAYRSEQIIPPFWAKHKDQIVMLEWGEQELTKLEIEWGDELTPAARDAIERGEAKSMGELLDRQATAFSLLSLLPRAKKLDPDYVKNETSFAKGLIEGKWGVKYVVVNEVGEKVAERASEANGDLIHHEVEK